MLPHVHRVGLLQGAQLLMDGQPNTQVLALGGHAARTTQNNNGRWAANVEFSLKT